MKPHRYLEGISLTAFGAGNRRMIRAVRPHAGKVRLTRQQLGGGLALLAFFSPVLARPVARYAPTAITVALVLWVVVAVVVGNTASPGTESGADGEALAGTWAEAGRDGCDGQDDELQDAPADADLYALIRYVAGMSDQGTAAHLSHVLEEGQARGLFGGWKIPDLRARLEGLGVALVEGKKLTFNGRQRNRLAVLLEALPESAPGTVPAVLHKAA
ncbi:hypothetical protein GCM10009760_01610 [Kitasatospora kazusensis]|uniref:Uncharacterized protein n=1 Tax=Kitasatospora kazusensis TaxID=407974 RepID=A0ABP5KB20_9ACTN